MDTREVVLYVAIVAGAIIVLCAVIAILKSLYACCCVPSRKRRRVRRHTPPVRTPAAAAHHSPGAHHHAPYTITVAPQLQPSQHHRYGATHPNSPPYGYPGAYAPGQWYGPAGGDAMASGITATAPPPYSEAVNSEAYKRQDAYNPGYQHAL